MLILHMFVISDYYFLVNGDYLFFLVVSFVIIKFIFDIRIKYKTFQHFKQFMNKLESM